MPSDLWLLQQEEERKRRAKLLGVGAVAAPAATPRTPASDAQVFRSYEQSHPAKATPVLQPTVDEHHAFLKRYDDLTTGLARPKVQQVGPQINPLKRDTFWENRTQAAAPDGWVTFQRATAKAKSPITDFYRLTNTMGKDKTEKRIQDIANLWSVYMAPFNGKSSIWDLVKSPYETDQIEEMLKSAHKMAIGAGGQTGISVLAPNLPKETNLDPHDPMQWAWMAMRSLAQGPARDLPSGVHPDPGVWDKYIRPFITGSPFNDTPEAKGAREAEAARMASMPFEQLVQYQWDKMTPQERINNPGWEPSERLRKQTLTDELEPLLAFAPEVSVGMTGLGMAARGLPYAGKAAQAAILGAKGVLGFGATSLALEKSAQAKGVQAGQNLMQTPIYQRDPAVFDAWKATDGWLSTAPQFDVKQAQEFAQKDHFDAYGNMVNRGVGQELDANGVMTPEWRVALMQQSMGGERAAANLFYEMQANDYIPSHYDFQGMDSKVFKDGFTRMEQAWADKVQWQTNDPKSYAAWEMSGVPHSRNAAGRFFNGLMAENWLTMLPMAGFKVGMMAASVPQIGVAFLKLSQQARTDPTYLQAARSAADAFEPPPNTTQHTLWEQDPIAYTARIVAATADSDPKAKEYQAKMNAATGELLTRVGFSGDPVLAAAYTVGLGDVGEQFAQDHPNWEMLAGVGMFLGATPFMGKVSPFRRGDPLPRTMDAVKSSDAFYRAATSVTNLVTGKNVEATGGRIEPVLGNIMDAAQRGDVVALQKLAGLEGPTGVRTATQVAEHVQTFEKKLAGNKAIAKDVGRLEKMGLTKDEAHLAVLEGVDADVLAEQVLARRGIVRAQPGEESVWARDTEIVESVGVETLRKQQESLQKRIGTLKVKVETEPVVTATPKPAEPLAWVYDKTTKRHTSADGFYVIGKEAGQYMLYVKDTAGELHSNWRGRGSLAGAKTWAEERIAKGLDGQTPIEAVPKLSASAKRLTKLEAEHADVSARLANARAIEPGSTPLAAKRGETIDQTATRIHYEIEQSLLQSDRSAWLLEERASLRNRVLDTVLSTTRENNIGFAAQLIGGIDNLSLPGVRGPRAFVRQADAMARGVGTEFTALTTEAVRDLRLRNRTAKQLFPDADPSFVSEVTRVAGEGRLDELPQILSQRQKLYGDIVKMDKYVQDELARWYTGHESVLPWLDSPLVPKTSEFRQMLHDEAAKIENRHIRVLVERANASLSLAPISSVEWSASNYVEHVFRKAIAASDGDVTWANQIRTMAVRAKSPTQMKAVEVLIRLKANRMFDRDKNVPPEQAMSVNPRFEPGTLENGKVQTGLVGTYPGKDPLTGQDVTIQTVPETTMLKATLSSPNTILAPRNRAAAEATFPVWDQITDGIRAAQRVGNKVSQPIRIGTVAMGAKLPMKHAGTDTSRTGIAIGPHRMVMYGKTRATKAKIMDKLPPEVADVQAGVRGRVIATEAHWQVPSGDGFGFNVKGIQAAPKQAAHALRVIVMSVPYKKWAEGFKADGFQGADTAVRAWLATNEGIRFLKDSGNLTRTRETWKMTGEAPMKGPEFKQAAIDMFVTEHVDMRYVEYETMAPKISATMRSMALNEQPLDVSALRRAIKDNPHENPTMSVQKPGGHSPMSMASWWIGNVLMAPNKANRAVMFDTVWTDMYKKMEKGGATPEQAATIAGNIAELSTQATHFDLSRALTLEQRNRYFAWFMTKHRLFATYVAKTAVQYPNIAGALGYFSNWLQEENREDGRPIWEREKINFEGSDGRSYSLDPALMTWMKEMPNESYIGDAMQTGLLYGLSAIGVNTNYTQPDFKQDFIPRLIPLAALVGKWYEINQITSDPNRPEIDKEESLRTLLDDMDQRTRDKWDKAMQLQYAAAAMDGRTITITQAARAAAVAGLIDYGFKFGVPISLSVKGQEQTTLEKWKKEYSLISNPSARLKYLEAHPGLLYYINQGNNAVEAIHIADGRARLNAADIAMQAAFAKALDDGTIMDKGVMRSAILARDSVRDAMLNSTDQANYNGDWAKWYQSADLKTTADYVGFTYPLVDKDILAQMLYQPDASTTEAKTAQLREAFDLEVANRGWTDKDKTTSEYRALKKEMVDAPLAEFTNAGAQDVRLSGDQWTVAKSLARGPEGQVRKDLFMSLVENGNKTDLWRKGFDSGKPAQTRLMGMELTKEQKAYIGLNPTQSSEAGWDYIRQLTRATKEYRIQNKITATSKEGKQLAADIKAAGDQIAAQDKEFSVEWQMSQMPLHERLMLVEVGSGNTKADQGMKEFLNLVDSFYGDLANSPVMRTDKNGKQVPTKKIGIGPGAMSAGDPTDYYLQEILKLKERNDEWWRVFKRRFGVEDFGFAWRLGGIYKGQDKALWRDYVPPASQDATNYTDELTLEGSY